MAALSTLRPKLLRVVPRLRLCNANSFIINVSRRSFAEAVRTAETVVSTSSKRIRWLRPRNVIFFSFFGLSGAIFMHWGGIGWLMDELSELDGSRAREREEAAREHQRHRQAEIERLRKEASLWRLIQIVVIMLPIAFWWPVWLADPHIFWEWVSARIDRCGPCFVKLAQWAATRRDLLPDSACIALGKLHESVSAHWAEEIMASRVHKSLRDADLDLETMDPRPHASGSMAEVFFGKLKNGTEVAVKCLRPGVRELLEADLAWLLRLGEFADSLESTRLLGLGRAAEEFCEHVQMQTDFRIEASHLNRFRSNFRGAPEMEFIRFPTPLFVTQDVLVLSRETGQELSRVFRAAMGQTKSAATKEISRPTTSSESEGGDGVDHMVAHADEVRSQLGIPEDLSRRIAHDSLAVYMRMIFKDAFVHGDLHPGNIMLQVSEHASQLQDVSKSSGAFSLLGRLWELGPGKIEKLLRGSDPFQVIILDAGLAIPLPREKVEALRSFTIAIIYADFNRAAEILFLQSPDTSSCWDPVGFKSGLAQAFQSCRMQIWEDGFVQVSDAVLEALRLVRHYNVSLDTTLTWTLLGMLSIEGSARQLDPEVDCAAAASRYILTLPCLWRELKSNSWHTSRHMLMEMMFSTLGLDYWAWRNSRGLTWSNYQPA